MHHLFGSISKWFMGNSQQMSSEINQFNSTNTHPQWAFWREQEGLFLLQQRGRMGRYGYLVCTKRRVAITLVVP